MYLKKKPYYFGDFIFLHLKCAPIYTLLSLLRNLLEALMPALQVLITALFVDTAISIFNGNAERDAIYLPLLYILITIVWSNLTGIFGNLIQIRIDARRTELFRAALLDKRARLEYKHIENNETWELTVRVCNDSDGRMSSGFSCLIGFIKLLITIFSLLSIIVTEVWWAGLAIIGLSIPLFFIAYKSGKKSYQANKDAQKHSRRADYLMGVMTGRENIEERTLFGYTSELNQQWYEKYEIARKINQKVKAINFVKMKTSGLITLVISAGIAAILIFLLQSSAITVGLFAGLITATFRLVQTLSENMVSMIVQFVDNNEYLKELTVFAALTEREGATDLPVGKNDFKLERIEFQGVTFAYPGTERIILQNFNLIIETGRHYAFVGVNGAGKTTVTKLLCGLYDNYEGEILINNKNLRDFTLSELKCLFSVVYQDFAKYYIPLYNSITLGDVNAMGDAPDDARFTNVLHTMELDEAVDKLPQGVNTWLGKIKTDGVDLSGGEWQRVAIARSLYSHAVVRILDEPTAALDPVAESNVYKMFGQISQGQTTIFITHRLGAARLADIIVVINDGCVSETGTHEELMQQNGLYASMFDAQRSWYQ